MNPLRTTVLMKTDISGSTSRFRELLAADLQALLGEHRDFLARHAAEHDGHIIKAAGDGHWLEFPSVTGAAKAAIEMQEALQRAGTWRYRALQSRRFLLRDVRRGRAGHCMGRAFDPELGSNSAPGAIRLHDQ